MKEFIYNPYDLLSIEKSIDNYISFFKEPFDFRSILIKVEKYIKNIKEFCIMARVIEPETVDKSIYINLEFRGVYDYYDFIVLEKFIKKDDYSFDYEFNDFINLIKKIFCYIDNNKIMNLQYTFGPNLPITIKKINIDLFQEGKVIEEFMEYLKYV